MTKVSKFLSQDGTVRIASVVSTHLIGDVLPKGKISSLAATIVGRATTAAVLMATYQKQGQKVGLYFRGEGPLGEVFAEASFDGQVRAYCAKTNAELPQGETCIGAGLGEGILEVVHSQPFQKDSHKGLVKIETGEIGDDIAQYYHQSHQTPCVVALTAMPSEKGCEWAGGYIVELMPGYSNETLERVEKIQENHPPLSELLANGADADELVGSYVLALHCEKLENSVVMHHHCSCSLDRISDSLATLGKTSLKEMIAENRIFDVTCQFCGQLHQINVLQLQKVVSALSSR